MKLAEQYLTLDKKVVNEDLPIKLQTALERLEKRPNAVRVKMAMELLTKLISAVSETATGTRLLKEFAPEAYAIVVRGEYDQGDEEDITDNASV